MPALDSRSRRVIGLCAGLALASCAATITDVALPAEPSHALPAALDSTVGQVFAPPGEDGLSRFAVVDRPDEGLDLRLGLAAVAEVSIDAQSYLWHEDAAGSLLLERLLEAADRGVRVRLLIDGFRLEGSEDLDEALDRHPNLELRVFNPELHRGGFWGFLELLEHAERLDHRMHNKLFLVDGVAAVFGGRNVGDEYFGLGDAFCFRDFDLLASGPVVEELGGSFDEFWNSGWAIPLADLVEGVGADEHPAARASLRALHEDDARLGQRRGLAREEWVAALRRASSLMVAGRAHVVRDSSHIERRGSTSAMAHAFERALAETPGDVLIVTAYLVPDEEFLENVRAHTAAGWRVRLLTNSLETTNQPLAHAGYQASRRRLLQAGAELYELRADAWGHVRHRSPGSRSAFLALHAKSAVFGEELVVVGSMNVDPRSMDLNTEMGVLVEGRDLAAWVRRSLEYELHPRNAWRVTLEEDGHYAWTAGDLRRRSEPSPGGWARLRLALLSLLPLRGEV